MKSIRQAKDLAGKRVLVRVDFNVRVNKNGEVDENEAFKIEAVLPTIKFLLEKKAKIVIMSHLGRPKGKIVSELKLDAAADHLSKLLKKLVKKTSGVVGPKVEKEVAKLKNGEILMLENVRFEKGEEANDSKFVKALAKLGDIFVNDAFGVCHREAASVSGVAKLLPSYAGLLLEAEVSALEKVMVKPKKPLLVIMGGLKFETKLPVIEK